MVNTYTIAMRDTLADMFRPIAGIPCNMTLPQAQTMANKARANGFDVVAYNTRVESDV